ncbi:MAG: transporter substrate-binding domain-containing protein [Defluviitaleaceae bacterium]|nr:transporter substrate-binding domain-containing protein [Defluviitaleaceae bacterium]
MIKIITLSVFSLFLVACGAGSTPTTQPPQVTQNAQQSTQSEQPAEQVSTPTLDALREQGYIRVGVFGATPPFGYITADGEFAGRDPYIARRLAYELFGDENAIEFVNTTAANRIPYLLSYHVDLILANFTVTPERQEQVDFALPYVRVALGIVAPEDSTFESVYDLYGHNLIVTQGTTAQIYFTQNHPDINLQIFGDNTESFAALQDGRGDAMAHDNGLLFAWAHNNPGFKIVEGNIGNQDVIAPAIRQGEPDLLEWLNETILRLREEQFFYHVYEVTLREHFHPDTNPSDHMYN